MDTNQIWALYDQALVRETQIAQSCQSLGNQVQNLVHSGPIKSIREGLSKDDTIDSSSWNSATAEEAIAASRRMSLLDQIHSSSFETMGASLEHSLRKQQDLYQK